MATGNMYINKFMMFGRIIFEICKWTHVLTVILCSSLEVK